jgi:hypothetical protein
MLLMGRLEPVFAGLGLQPGVQPYGNSLAHSQLSLRFQAMRSASMTFGKGLLLWLIGIPLPIILLLALFWHN